MIRRPVTRAFVAAIVLLSGTLPLRAEEPPNLEDLERRIEAAKRAQAQQEAARAEAARKAAAEKQAAAQRAEADRQAAAAREEAGRREAEQQEKERRKLLQPAMVTIPAGSFRMGDLAGNGESDEKPVHTVTISRSFALGKYEVTFAEYDAFAEATGRQKPGDEGWGRGNRPVINVSWEDAAAYAQWLSQQTSKRYRLPSEAEWEYAARAGSTTVYPWGNTASHEYANYGKDECCDGLASGRDSWVNTAPVGSFAANAFGLYDTIGNVWEWLEDCYDDSYSGAPTDGSAKRSCGTQYRVARGGSWFNFPAGVRSAGRGRDAPSGRGNVLGFRLAEDLP